MKPSRSVGFVALLGLALMAVLSPNPARCAPSPGNRLTYLDEDDPFYPHRDFPKLITPQWVGEPGVEAVVILSIDDMRETPKYEAFLRPILNRLKQIDGRAPVSIMVNAVAPTNAQLQAWLKEGLSLQVHTLAHPCPCLAKGDFNAAANTYHGCVELMNQIPGNKPVAFRMPCCDSMNSLSPRFLAEIFNRANGAGQFLTIDSSVFCLLTTNDTTLPRDLVLDADGREKFRKYFPAETNAITRVSLKNYAGYIEDYPYPYVVGKLCWQFPCMVPSDWEAFNLFGPTNATLLADWKAALDAVVLKQGVFTFVFHPHGWSSPQQFVEFIDYAVKKHGKKVKFLTFKEAQERLDKNLLAGQPLRVTEGKDYGVRLLDLDNDGFMDVTINNAQGTWTRFWNARSSTWGQTAFPPWPVQKQFGVLTPDGHAALFQALWVSKPNVLRWNAWIFNGVVWEIRAEFLNGLDSTNAPPLTYPSSTGVRLRDVDRDGICELIVGNESQNAVFAWSGAMKSWKKLPYALPRGTSIVDAEGRDAGLRFVDVNGDGYDDVLFSNEGRFSLHLFIPKANPRLMWEVGWNDQVWAGKRGGSTGHWPVPPGDSPGGTTGAAPNPAGTGVHGITSVVPVGGSPTGTGESPVPPTDLNIPMIVRGGTNRNNGVWFKNGAMWVQNEDTAHLPDKVDKRTFRQLLTADQPPPLSPEQALQSMRPRPGFKVELVAAEPLVLDPIAFDWGADGRLWVVDMFDYPLGPRGDGKPGGKIKVLEDTDGDGRCDKATVFLDDVNFPTGLLPWRNGVLVAAAPEIFYAEDTDGDGKADKRSTLFTGFVEGNQQHRLNGFDYGLDNWIYGANGDSGGTISSALKTEQRPVSIRNRDFRFRPDTGEFEAIEGGTQYGRHRDDWGNWFGNNNPVWLWHYFLPERYVARNPHLTVKTTKRMLANYENSGRVFPASKTRQRFNDHHHFNHVTSANSPMPYRDELFGPDFATSVFISDPVHNLVHREVLEPDGVSFTSHRAGDETNREFLASTDLWFRPTMLKTGPDGALYVADMYRLVIEHPEWIPDWMEERMDLRAGSDKGRIYRVFPGGATLRQVPNLAKLDTAGLVAALDSPTGWQRDTAQRLLVERKDKATIEPLRELAIENERAKTRLQALCTLEGMDMLTLEDIQRAVRDSHPSVREHAVRLSEHILSRPAVAAGSEAAVLALVEDSEVRVLYQLAFSLGGPGFPPEQAGLALAKLSAQAHRDRALETAALSSLPRYMEPLLRMLATENAGLAFPNFLEPLVSATLAANDRPSIVAMLKALGEMPGGVGYSTFSPFATLLDGLERRNQTLHQLAAGVGLEDRVLIDNIERLLPLARSVAMSERYKVLDRRAAIRLLGRTPDEREADLQKLGQLLGAQEPILIQQAALAALARQRDRAAADVLLATWKGHGPALRTEVLNVLVGRLDWCRALLAAVQKGEVPAGQIESTFQQKLLNHPDATIKKRAAELFSAVSKDRQALLSQYAGVAKLTGDSARGMELYRQQCATCHRLRGEGSDVGPDLGTVAGKDEQALLVAILDPNQAVDWRYATYSATTKDDREFSGIIVAETANGVTLRGPGGREETFLRADLREFKGSDLSLMPEGLEAALGPQAMADLLAALRGN